MNAHRLRQPLALGSYVLAQNILKVSSHGRKLDPRWFGPFRVKDRLAGGSYLLEELDGVEMKGLYAAKRLRHYFPRGEFMAVIEDGILGDGQDNDDQLPESTQQGGEDGVESDTSSEESGTEGGNSDATFSLGGPDSSLSVFATRL